MKPHAIKWFLASRFASSLSDQLITFAVPILVYRSTQSLAYSGLAFAIEWIPRLISLPLSGSWVDRYGPKKLFILSDMARVILSVLAFLLCQAEFAQYALLIAAVGGAIGFFHETSFVSLEVFLPQVLDKKRISQCQSLLQTMDQASMIVGPMLAAFITTQLASSAIFLVMSVIFLMSLGNLLLLFTRHEFHFSLSHPSQSFLSGLSKSFVFLFSSPRMLSLMLTGIVGNLLVGTILASGPGYVQKVFAKGEGAYGTLAVLSGVVGVTVYLVVPFVLKKISLRLLAAGSITMGTLCALSIGLSGDYMFYALGYVGLIPSIGLFGIYIRTSRALHTPIDQLGSVTGLMMLIMLSSLPLSGLILATFSDPAQLASIMIGLSFVMLLTGIFSLSLDPGQAQEPPALAFAEPQEP